MSPDANPLEPANTTTETPPKLDCRNLWKVFGNGNAEQLVDSPDAWLPREELLDKTGSVAAVRDVSFSVDAGEIFAIMGLSGSGKSTLVRCLSRLVEPTRGQISLDGVDLLTMADKDLRDVRRHTMTMVFQNFGLLPNRTVMDNISYILEIRGDERHARRERAEELIELVGLNGFAHHYPDELSGGMMQRVGLARALAPAPDIMLLDEPFSALDPLIRSEMQDEVIRLQRELQTTMVFITHDLREALHLGDHIGIMRDGSMAQIGTAADLLNNPADDYVREFTRDVPRDFVLRAEDICDPTVTDGQVDVGADTVLHDLIPLIAGDAHLRVRDASGGVIGGITPTQVLSAIYGAPLDTPEPTR